VSGQIRCALEIVDAGEVLRRLCRRADARSPTKVGKKASGREDYRVRLTERINLCHTILLPAGDRPGVGGYLIVRQTCARRK
jgi:hypothetical protein